MMDRFKGRVSGQALGALEIAFGVNNKQSAMAEYFAYFGNTFTGHWGLSLTSSLTKSLMWCFPLFRGPSGW